MDKDTREKVIIGFYAHDYRGMKLSEDDLEDLLEEFMRVIKCDHICSGNCRREGCNCDCGEFHF